MRRKANKASSSIKLEMALRYFRQSQTFEIQFNNPSIESAINAVIEAAEKHNKQIAPEKDSISLRISRSAYADIMKSICSRPAESGGILIGPVELNDVTLFYFDNGAKCSGTTYTPDINTLRRKMKEEWLPAGLDMKGFVHSHPGRLDRLTEGDLSYIQRLLEKNDDMEFFAAPIVIPEEFRMRPLVVSRQNPDRPQDVKLVLI